jgi:glycosidase
MPTEIFSPEVAQTLRAAKSAAGARSTRTVLVGGDAVTIRRPFPSPADWRDCPIYFLVLDRFNNPDAPPRSESLAPPIAWNQRFGFRQGGTFRGVQRQLGYITGLGAGAIWISPVVKNSAPADWEYNYHGYAAQDFLSIDGRFGSDGTSATARQELIELVDEAHARGLYVILDMVINHAARVFDYVRDGAVVDSFADAGVMNGPLGDEPPIEWLNGLGFPRADWQNAMPPAAQLSPDDAVWPADLQRAEFFRRRGSKLSDAATPFAKGDFGSMRQLVAEYDATVPGQEDLRALYGRSPVLEILVRSYQYLIALLDVDGFRIDTVKYVDPTAVQTFGNAIREFALSIGKSNFFTFGEIYDDEATIDQFVGRHSSEVDSFGIDAALDFPLFFILPRVAKALADVDALRQVFLARKAAEQALVSSHGEAGRYFVSLLDNHDQQERFHHPSTQADQVEVGLALLYCLQGIPCLYYGTEQGLTGTVDGNGNPDLSSLESVREALWGNAGAFDPANRFYLTVQRLTAVRAAEPALRYGRLYFRQVSGNGRDFGYSTGAGGIVAFSRVLDDREVLVVANTSPTTPFHGSVLVDLDLSRGGRTMQAAYDSAGAAGGTVSILLGAATIWDPAGSANRANIAAVPVDLAPMQAMILAPD